MPPLSDLLIALGLAAALGGTVVAVLARPLYHALTDLCGTRERALFWAAYLGTMLMLAPLLGVSYLAAYTSEPMMFTQTLNRILFHALLCLTAALGVVGWSIWRPINRLVNQDTPCR